MSMTRRQFLVRATGTFAVTSALTTVALPHAAPPEEAAWSPTFIEVVSDVDVSFWGGMFYIPELAQFPGDPEAWMAKDPGEGDWFRDFRHPVVERLIGTGRAGHEFQITAVQRDAACRVRLFTVRTRPASAATRFLYPERIVPDDPTDRPQQQPPGRRPTRLLTFAPR